LQASTDDDYGDDEDEDDEDDEGTAKIVADKQHSPNSSSDWRGTVSQNRLSTLFEGWLRSPPSSPNNNRGNRNTVIHSPDKRMSIVSEPVLVENKVLRSSNSESNTDDESDLDETAFDQMLVCHSFFTLHIF
jgi:diaphanous 1